jgi:hypothetical protein
MPCSLLKHFQISYGYNKQGDAPTKTLLRCQSKPASLTYRHYLILMRQNKRKEQAKETKHVQ